MLEAFIDEIGGKISWLTAPFHNFHSISLYSNKVKPTYAVGEKKTLKGNILRYNKSGYPYHKVKKDNWCPIFTLKRLFILKGSNFYIFYEYFLYEFLLKVKDTGRYWVFHLN